MDHHVSHLLKYRKNSTIDWLCHHLNKATGKPFLTLENQNAADKFAGLCEKMIANYRLSRWDDYVDKGHLKTHTSLMGNVRKILHHSLETLGKDAELTADIVIKNFSLSAVEKKHKIGRGKAKIILKDALDRLVDLFLLSKNKKS
ncbi:MAG: hypothetical protein ACJARD_000889 [Alphaproteobacteria bacterium]|jgi:hypothetical protein